MSKKLEEQIDYGDYPERIDPGTERSLGDPEKNLYGTNPAMRGGTQDVERLASDRFKKVVDKLRGAINIPDLTPEYVREMIMMEFMRSTMRAKSIELRFTEELEELAVNAALKATETPEGKYNIDAKLTGDINGIDPEKFQFKPKPNPQFDKKGGEQGQEGGEQGQEGGEENNEERFDANVLTKDERFQLEVHKRNIINGIIQGAAKKGHYIFQDPEIKAKLDEMDTNLYGYYLKLMAINDYFYFTMNDLIDMMSETGKGIGGREDLTGNKKPEGQEGNEEGDEEGEGGGEGELEKHEVSEHNIKARAVLFPILCHEVIKGIEEALGKFGYSNEPDIATAVIGQSDTLPNEKMSLRIGPELVDRVRKYLPNEMFDEENHGIKPFFYKILYEIPAIPFLNLIGDVISQNEGDNNNAKNKFKEIFSQAMDMKQRYDQKRNPQNAIPQEPEIHTHKPEIQKEPEGPVENIDKKLSEMGVNALNFELNNAIDTENWELASKIQKIIERKQGLHEITVKNLRKRLK
jgi:predicted  nucleic acid-binding Zn-ribbon protein